MHAPRMQMKNLQNMDICKAQMFQRFIQNVHAARMMNMYNILRTYFTQSVRRAHTEITAYRQRIDLHMHGHFRVFRLTAGPSGEYRRKEKERECRA